MINYAAPEGKKENIDSTAEERKKNVVFGVEGSERGGALQGVSLRGEWVKQNVRWFILQMSPSIYSSLVFSSHSVAYHSVSVLFLFLCSLFPIPHSIFLTVLEQKLYSMLVSPH
jgi:hypothetical protein